MSFFKRMTIHDVFETLESRIAEALDAEIQPIRKAVGDEQVYAVALVTDSDCITLFLAVNTYEYLKKKDEDYVERFKDLFSEEQIRRIHEGSEHITKWSPDEWGYSNSKKSRLVKISKLLCEQEAADPEGYEAHQQEFLDIVTSALKTFADRNVFGGDRDAVTYFVSMSDDERTPEIECKSAKLLNSERAYREVVESWEADE